MAAAAELNCFGMLGLTPQQLSTLKQWTSGAGSPGGSLTGSWCRGSNKVVQVILRKNRFLIILAMKHP